MNEGGKPGEAGGLAACTVAQVQVLSSYTSLVVRQKYCRQQWEAAVQESACSILAACCISCQPAEHQAGGNVHAICRHTAMQVKEGS